MAEFGVTAESSGSMELKVKARQFEFTVDEPPSLGGLDNGPTPVEYVLGGLLGCLNVMTYVVAGEMEIEVRGVKAEAKGELDPSKVLGTPSDNRAGFSIIEVVLEVDCDATPEQLETLLETVESRCPVSDNLANLTPVEIGIKKA